MPLFVQGGLQGSTAISSPCVGCRRVPCERGDCNTKEVSCGMLSHYDCCVLTLLVENRTEPEMGSRSELLLFISEKKVGYTHTRKWRHASIE